MNLKSYFVAQNLFVTKNLKFLIQLQFFSMFLLIFIMIQEKWLCFNLLLKIIPSFLKNIELFYTKLHC